MPGDNRKLAYEVDLYPSYKYLDGSIRALACPDGKQWLLLSAEYAHSMNGNGVSVSVQLQGMKYAATLYSGTAKPGSPTALCVTDLAAAARNRPADADRVSVTLSAAYEDPGTGEIKYANMSKALGLSDAGAWEATETQYSLAETGAYLGRLQPLRPRQETTTEGDGMDGTEN
ncbi:MAG: hypothetical protein NC311_12445 [Muribaculaceae bacterium]|nr:hypothetical protein [Muribaculaceae bacterium]